MTALSLKNYAIVLTFAIVSCGAFAFHNPIPCSFPSAPTESLYKFTQPLQKSTTTKRLDTQVSVALPSHDEENKEEECSPDPRASGPSTHFGSPIDEATKKRNRELIHTAKSYLFDTLFSGKEVTRNYARFYALENIARMPYFSYLSVLHLYETLNRWRQSDYLKVHFSESWNEQHHLLIMEELGGSDRWTDRFVAQHVAFFYYWIVVALYLVNPTFAYNLNQAVEEEAYQTYDNFIENNKEFLESQPAPEVAKKYYLGEDLYLFDAMHYDANGNRGTPRRPKMETLLDAFTAIRDDELEHVKTMAYLQEDSCQ